MLWKLFFVLFLYSKLKVPKQNIIYSNEIGSHSAISSSSLFCQALISDTITETATTSHNNQQPIDSIHDSKEVQDGSVPLLPEPSAASEELLKLNLGETFKMDHLGPIIINPDGTTRRIANWDTLSPIEKETSWRMISARNKKRIAALQKAKEEAEASESTSTNEDVENN
jgi:hypothetical protein